MAALERHGWRDDPLERRIGVHIEHHPHTALHPYVGRVVLTHRGYELHTVECKLELYCLGAAARPAALHIRACSVLQVCYCWDDAEAGVRPAWTALLRPHARHARETRQETATQGNSIIGVKAQITSVSQSGSPAKYLPDTHTAVVELMTSPDTNGVYLHVFSLR